MKEGMAFVTDQAPEKSQAELMRERLADMKAAEKEDKAHKAQRPPLNPHHLSAVTVRTHGFNKKLRDG